MRYSDNYDVLVALIIHLSACERRSKSPNDIHKAIGEVFEEQDIKETLNQFPSFFRKGRDDQNVYTVHLRYAKRLKQNGKTISAPLNEEEIGIQLAQLSKMIEIEREDNRLEKRIEETGKNLEKELKSSGEQFQATLKLHQKRNNITLIVASISALAAISAALISFSATIQKNNESKTEIAIESN